MLPPHWVINRFSFQFNALHFPTGIIIWIPQLYINYKLRLWQRIVWLSVLNKFWFFIGQILCFAYFLQTGLFWLVIRHHPFAIVGQSIYGLIYLTLIYQFQYYARNFDLGGQQNQQSDETELVQVVGNKKLPDLLPDQVPNSQVKFNQTRRKIDFRSLPATSAIMHSIVMIQSKKY